jgi:hypothetical protein
MPDETEFSVGVSLGIRFGSGSHSAGETVFIKANAVAVRDQVAVEVGAELAESKVVKMYGLEGRDSVGRTTQSVHLRWLAGVTLGENQRFVGLDAGSSRPFRFDDGGPNSNASLTYSLAVGQDISLYQPPKLRALQNTRGFSQFSLIKGATRVTPFYFENDVSMPVLGVFGGGTDHGLTHRSKMFVDIKRGEHIVTQGLNLELVTPAPIRDGQKLQVPGAVNGVYPHDPASPAVYGGNLYFTAKVQTLDISVSMNGGVDSQLLGCEVQRIIHQGPGGPGILGLLRGTQSPLFPWTSSGAPYAPNGAYSCPSTGTRPYWDVTGEVGPTAGRR